MRTLAIVILASISWSCRTAPEPLAADPFWTAVSSLCGRAFEGTLVEGTAPGDAEMGRQRLVMHVRSCSDRTIRIPFHVGDDHSRTWVLSRTATGVRLKHDHRHEDGTEDEVTQYGGDSASAAPGLSIDFPADAFTAQLLPAAATNVWTMAIDPGRRFTYALRRPGRRFRVDFDLTREVATPPAPWGNELTIDQ